MDSVRSRRRFLLAGIAGVVAIQTAGRLLELGRLGGSNDATFGRVKSHVSRDFASMAVSLESLAADLAAQPEVARSGGNEPEPRARLFAAVRSAAAASDPGVAITVYDAGAAACAWTGRPSEIPAQRVLGERAFFVAPGPLGLRLVYVEPVFDRSRGADPPQRRGSIAAERVLSPAPGITETPSDAFRIDAPIADVVVRACRGVCTRGRGPRSFALRSPDGEPLLAAVVSDADLRAARERWRLTVRNLTLTFVALVVLAGVAPAAMPASRRATVGHYLRLAGLAAPGVVVAALLLHAASTPAPLRSRLFEPEVYRSLRYPELLRSPADLLLGGALAVVLAVLAAAWLERCRRAAHGRRGAPSGRRAPWFLLTHVIGGALLAAILAGLDAVTADAAFASAVDLLHTALWPWDAGRVALLAGLLLAAVGSVWSGVVVLAATRVVWRHPRRAPVLLAAAVAGWSLPGLTVVAVRGQPALPFVVLLAGTVGAALCIPALRPRFRRASHASRMLAVFLALVLPALLFYPSLWRHADRAKRTLVETRFARQAARYPDELQAHLARSLAQIDAIPELPSMTRPAPARRLDQLDTDRAFSVWRQTDLARLRLTSAIELYSPAGDLISRFALNFPEYADVPQNWTSSTCDWEIFGEAAPFGSEQRRILHGDRALCAPARGGSVVVHLALDYQALPFISPRNPYAELLGERPGPPAGRPVGRDVELVIYGWGLQPTFASGPSAWLLDDELFSRVYASRTPFWTSRAKSGRNYAVYVTNNRAGIYALGYPAFGLFDHLVRLVEIAACAGVLCLACFLIAACAAPWTAGRQRFGRGLWREIRTSFHRRLLLAFVAATVIPVLALAAVIRTYYAAQLRADVESGAARTAALAQRVIEESPALLPAGAAAPVLNDDLLVFISQIIDQDVNVFEGSQLMATSERDLFTSGLLPTRTPDRVYDAVVLERVPGYVVEDAVGSLRHLLAAAPLRAGGRDAILTVPLASRQQEIEDQIADLDRGILLGAALFILLGAGSGFYLAERIADPVKRLTRATRQLARGNFDARVSVRSADELQRLVTAFNRMAIDLEDQQRRLERTHRLEAWAEMARQVAHEIKNPLTPVQLSAEHLLRVHRDRGEPLSPVLQSCVDSILAQVRILRRISSEFSNYASSPAVSRGPTDLAALVHGVLTPYRVGVEGRIAVSIEIPAGCPAVLVDSTLVERALTNVIDNALHAMPGRGALRVRADVAAAGVTLAVTDTGAGVEPAALRRIFEPYFSTRASGTGLGMAIARRNVESSGGSIRVESRTERGTTVTMTLPLASPSRSGS